MSPSVILWDVMDTLVHDPFKATVPRVFGLPLEDYFAAKDRETYLAFEEGRIDEQTYADRLFLDRRHVELAPLKAAFMEGYAYIDGIPELLDELTTLGVEMHALSNYSIFYEMIETKLELSRWMPWTFVSCKTGRRKPHPDTYTEAVASLGRLPGDAVFVDDRLKNCRGAQAVGLHAFVFRGASDARTRLRELGFQLSE